MALVILPPLSEECARHACAMFDAWCREHNLELNKPLVRELFKTERYPAYAMCNGLVELCRQYSLEHLDQWWEQQGRAQFWNKETQTPCPEIAHLLLFAAEYNARDVMEWTLKKGWAPEGVMSTAGGLGYTVLHYFVADAFGPPSAQKAYDAILHQLMTPATLNSQNQHGETPLIRLLYEGAGESFMKECFARCTHLIRAGADVSLPNKAGITPLHFLMNTAYHEEDMPFICDIAALLLKEGADPSACTKRGSTCLDVLEASDNDEEFKEALRPLLVRAMCERNAQALKACLTQTETPERFGSAPPVVLRKRL